MRIQCSLALLHTFICVLLDSIFLTMTSDYDHTLYAGIQTLRCVPLCTATYSTDALLDSVSA